ncbi:MAG: helix-turn-helix transcriptional regulator [Bacilli bacterium]|nr:helix-turn-helix transcriptional regulator [Bacilli bacterium]
MNYQKQIKRIRNELLITQEELAAMLGVTFATVNRWENGHHEPTIKQQRRIRDLCKKKHVPYGEVE